MSAHGSTRPSLIFTTIVVATSVLLAPRPGEAQEVVIGPRLEDDVRRLVLAEEGDDAALLPGGWQVDHVQIRPDLIAVYIESHGREATVALVPDQPTSSQGAGERLGRTPSFSVRLLRGGDEPGARDAATALLRRIAARDDGRFLERVRRSPPVYEPRVERRRGRAPEHARHLGPLDDARRLLTWLALVAMLSVLALRWLREPERSRSLLMAMIGVCLGALALRLMVPPWAPLHANSHGIAELRGLSGALGSSPFISESDRYGVAFPQLVRAVLWPLGRNGAAPLALSAVFGALTVIPFFHLTRTLVPSRPWAAVAAAVGLAVHPAHVRLSLSASPGALLGFLLLVAMAAGVRACDEEREMGERRLLAWVCGCALALACELRVLTLLVPLAVALALSAPCLSGRRGAKLRVFLGPALFVAFAEALHLVALAPVLAPASSRSWPALGALASSLWSPRNIALDAALTSPLLLVLALAGVVALVVSRRAVSLVVVLAPLLVLWAPSFLISACRTDAIRYQTVNHLLLFVLPAALCLGEGRGVLARRGLREGLVAVALVSSSVIGLLDIARPDFQEASYRIAVEQSPAPPAQIVIPPARMSDGRVLSDYPDYFLDDPRRVIVAGDERRGACAVYVGPACWSFSSPDEARDHGVDVRGGLLRSECVELLGGAEAADTALARLRPLPVPHRDLEFLTIVARQPRVGFVACDEGR